MSNEIFRQAAQRTEDCPAVEEWAGYLAAQAPLPDAARFERHRENCAACQAELAMLTSFLQAEPEPAEAADLQYITAKLRASQGAAADDRAPWWQSLLGPSMFRVWAMAAVAMLVVGIGLQWRSSMLPPVQQEVEGLVRSGPVVEVLSAGGDQAQAPSRWEWRPVAGATGYQVQILSVDGSELWKSPLTSQAFYGELPESAFVERKTVAIKVTAFDAGGKVLGASPEMRIRVLPSGSSAR